MSNARTYGREIETYMRSQASASAHRAHFASSLISRDERNTYEERQSKAYSEYNGAGDEVMAGHFLAGLNAVGVKVYSNTLTSGQAFLFSTFSVSPFIPDAVSLWRENLTIYTRIARGFCILLHFINIILCFDVMGAPNALEIRAALSPAITRSKGRNSPPDAIITSRNLIGKCRKRMHSSLVQIQS
jgi:hypothetical protein